MRAFEVNRLRVPGTSSPAKLRGISKEPPLKPPIASPAKIEESKVTK